jgi:hypothetical protein
VIGDEIRMIVKFEGSPSFKNCRIVIQGAGGPAVMARVTDPVIQVPHNAYMRAYDAKEVLWVHARPMLRDDVVERWYITGHD